MRAPLPLLLLAALALLGCPKKPSEAPSPGDGRKEEACVDAWLAARGLDPYGSSEGTMYAGGSPLFDERTGETTDRLEYVYAKHPEARAACGRDARSPRQ